MSSHAVTIEPRSQSIDAMSVSADVRLDQANDRWDVTVVFSRAPDLPPMQARDVDARLLDAQDSALPVVERPSGVLIEFGGSLGNSVNARFRFRDGKQPPAQLVVTYREQEARFRIRSTASP